MTKDTACYNFKTASCYGDATIEDTGAMQRPLLEDTESLIPQKLLLQQQQHEKNVSPPAVSKGLRSRFVLVGFVVGIFVQALTFGSFEVLLRLLGGNAQPERQSDFLYLMMVLSQIDIVIYLTIPIGFAYFSTSRGSLYFQKKFDLEEASSMNRLDIEDFVFVLNVSFFLGVLLGLFLGWLVVDILKGLPVTVLPFLTMVVFDIVIYYLLLRSYDWVVEQQESEEESAEEVRENRMEIP
jgi:F0F1-type ATP synthase assembly protein I